MSLPNDVVDEIVPLRIGTVEAELEIHSYELKPTTVTYKPNQVRVTGHTKTSNGIDGIVGQVDFTVTEEIWRRLNADARGDA